ncbi:uncharacterized protein LOC132618935 [Lycium barbarum]|uniref:uncharacterized protein LOC132618935 n=1 Tax=Lycium barbarum TaxID=112863 RepID=UPI00293F0F7E|nr:uncharacterized protein LOC132618935 [Lycium barbarum]
MMNCCSSPPQKKPKINEETSSSAETTIFPVDEDDDFDDDTSSPITPDTYDSEEDYCPDYPNGKMDKALWDKYYKQVEESEGFDIEDFPGRCWMTTVFPLPYYLDCPKNVNKLKDYAGRALKLYNDSNGTSYVVDEILKVNGGGCRAFIFYITFSVKNGVDNIFQAKVSEDIGYHLEFPIVRPKRKVVVG